MEPKFEMAPYKPISGFPLFRNDKIPWFSIFGKFPGMIFLFEIFPEQNY